MHRGMLLAGLVAIAVTLSHGSARADEVFFARFSGFQEIGGLGAGETGAILSDGKATLRLDVNKHASTINYTLTYSDLGSNVTQAHIHFGKRHVAGGVIVFLCSNLASPPPGTPACPLPGGTVSGVVSAASVIGPTAQGVTPGNFDALIEILESNTAYGNIHTTNFPAGEIRGQIHRGFDDHK
jgi:hypothetical protein